MTEIEQLDRVIEGAVSNLRTKEIMLHEYERAVADMRVALKKTVTERNQLVQNELCEKIESESQSTLGFLKGVFFG